MKKILVFQHIAREILGTFHPLLREAGFRIRYVNFCREPAAKVDVNAYDGLVVLGGPMGVYEAHTYPHLVEEMRWIREAIDRDKPILGICLGAQLTAAALGAEVKQAPVPEVGWHPVTLTDEGTKDPILGAFGPEETIFQWHGDTFAIPGGAAWLARSATCPHQAFRYGDRVYGFQFHLEVDEPMIERALTNPVSAKEIEAMRGTADPARMREDTHRYLGRQKALSREVFSRFIARFSTKRRSKHL